MLRRIPSVLAALVVPAILSGCIDHAEILELRPDGSGRLEVRQTIDMDVLEQVQQLMSSMGGGDADKGLAYFEKEPLERVLGGRDGLRIEKIEIVDRKDDDGVRLRDVLIIVEFDSPEALVVGEASLVLRPFSLESTDAGYRFEREVGLGPEDVQAIVDEKRDDKDNGDGLELDEAQIEGFRSLAGQILLGRKATFELRMPGPVTGANVPPEGGRVEGSTVQWEYPLSDLIARSVQLEAQASRAAATEDGQER